MKKLLILLCFLCSISTHAQTLKEKIDAIVSPEQVSTGIPNQNLPTSNNATTFTASISGSDATICTNTPTTYTLNTSIPLPAGSTINWIIPDYGIVTFTGQGTSQVNYFANANTRLFLVF